MSTDETAGRPITISVDAMGGDNGPQAVVAGVDRCATQNPDVRFILHGDKKALKKLLKRRRHLKEFCEVRATQDVVTMEDKPAQVLRNGQQSSMWSTIDAVREHEADAAVSCGNTGALMALSMIRLRKLEGVNRPAIAVLWPSRDAGRHNIILDAGADIRADETDLLQYALMGASYARNGLGVPRPRVGLLNVGTEEHKGRPELKAAGELIASAVEEAELEYVGFVEGGDLPSRKVDVIVTDGFTGNVALKTAEGTARLFRDFLREAFKATPLSRIAAVLAYTSLRRLNIRIDPRRVNGGVFLGLNGTVIKSHGAADATGMAAAVSLAIDLARSGFSRRLAARVASAGRARKDDAGTGGQSEQTE